VKGFGACLLLLSGPLRIAAQEFKDFERRVSEFALPNGLQFLVVERHDTPVVSFHTYVRVGTADDVTGQTGMAYLVDRALFNGTDTIGSKNWPEERKAVDTVEETYDRLEQERNLGPKANQGRIDTLETHVRLAIDAAARYGIPEAYVGALHEIGGVDPARNTSADGTECSYSLPSNRIELWFLMESQRLQKPVFRDFYGLRNAAAEDWQKRVAGSVQAQLFGALMATAFVAHPYRNPPGGWPGDMASLRRPKARAFFEKYYAPGNVVMTLVGDANPAELKALAAKYFGSWQAKPLPPPVPTQEPPQTTPKTAFVENAGTAQMVIGYKRPNQFDKDDPAFDLLQVLLAYGKSGLLHNELIANKHLAQTVETSSTMPAGRYPNLFLIRVIAAQGHTLEENQQAVDEFLNRLKLQVVPGALARAKVQARSMVYNRLMTNPGLAALLGSYQANYGDWRMLFTSLDDLNKVTTEDIQRLLVKYLVPAGRTTAYTVLPGASPRPVQKAGDQQ